jgi:hypothetical protein
MKKIVAFKDNDTGRYFYRCGRCMHEFITLASSVQAYLHRSTCVQVPKLHTLQILLFNHFIFSMS